MKKNSHKQPSLTVHPTNEEVKEMDMKERSNYIIDRMEDVDWLKEQGGIQFIQFMFDIIYVDQRDDYLTMVLDRCREIKKNNSAMFLENYQELLVEFLMECMREKKPHYCDLFLASDTITIDVHADNQNCDSFNFALIAAYVGDCKMLAYFIERGSDFTHKNKSNENIFHVVGDRESVEATRITGLECIEYLLRSSDKCRNYLVESNYEMMFEKNKEGHEPLVHFLNRGRTAFAQAVLDHIEDNDDVVGKIHQQLNAYCAKNKLSAEALEVVTQLNEKIMIKNEKVVFNSVIQNSKNGITKTSFHKI